MILIALNSLGVERWLWVWEVPGSIPNSQGQCHTKDVIKFEFVLQYILPSWYLFQGLLNTDAINCFCVYLPVVGRNSKWPSVKTMVGFKVQAWGAWGLVIRWPHTGQHVIIVRNHPHDQSLTLYSLSSTMIVVAKVQRPPKSCNM